MNVDICTYRLQRLRRDQGHLRGRRLLRVGGAALRRHRDALAGDLAQTAQRLRSRPLAARIRL